MNFSHTAPGALTLNRRQLATATLAGAGLGAAALATAPAAHAAAGDLTSVSTSRYLTDAQELLDLINNFRGYYGKAPVRHSATVANVMTGEAERQFVQGYVSHSTQFLTNPNVQGYSFSREVIALSYNNDLNELLGFWKSSPAHRDAVLASEANTMGIGLAYGNGSTLPWRVVGNVGIYNYSGSNGPDDIQATVSGSSLSVQSSGNYSIGGAIGSKYFADGGEATYGKPVMNEYKGLSYGGAYQTFSTGSRSYKFLWTLGTGAHPVFEQGAIGQLWSSRGFENGLGYPVTDEVSGITGGGAYQLFRKGSFYSKVLWHPAYGAHVVKESGAIGHQWKLAGFERGYGYPVTDEYNVGSEVHQRFSNGVTVAWSSTNYSVRTFNS